MQYSHDNLLVSVSKHFATFFPSLGYDVFWHASGDTDAETAGQKIGTITLVQKVPQNPTFIVGEDVGNLSQGDQIVLPAFAVHVMPPRKVRRYGIGDPRFEREVQIFVLGMASDSRQQATLASELYEWLDVGDTSYYLDIWDYESNPSSPSTLEPAELWRTSMDTPEVADEVDVIRYQINIELALRFVE